MNIYLWCALATFLILFAMSGVWEMKPPEIVLCTLIWPLIWVGWVIIIILNILDLLEEIFCTPLSGDDDQHL